MEKETRKGKGKGKDFLMKGYPKKGKRKGKGKLFPNERIPYERERERQRIP